MFIIIIKAKLINIKIIALDRDSLFNARVESRFFFLQLGIIYKGKSLEYMVY